MSKKYYEIIPGTLDSAPVNQAVSYNPKIRLHELGQPLTFVDEGEYWFTWEYDPQAVTITKNGETVEQETSVTGPFEIKRLSEEKTQPYLKAFMPWSGGGSYRMDHIYLTLGSDGEGVETEHSLKHYAAVAPTCTKAGNSEYWSCSTCGRYFSDKNAETAITDGSWVIAAVGHKWGAEKVSKKATASAPGEYSKTCSVCKATETTRAIPKITMKASAKAKTLTAYANKKTTIKAAKAYKVTGAKGKLTYKKLKGDKKITIAKNGKITVKKGLKKGKTYVVKVKVTSAATAEYKAVTKTVTLKIKVK